MTSAEARAELAGLAGDLESLELTERSLREGIRSSLPWHVGRQQERLREVLGTLGEVRARVAFLEALTPLLAAAEAGQEEMPWCGGRSGS